MNNQQNSQLKSLSEIIQDLSDNDKSIGIQENIFLNMNSKSEVKQVQTHKINSLESEFYTPNTTETVFSNDMLLEQKLIQLKKKLEIINKKITAEKTFEHNNNLPALIAQKNTILNEYNVVLKKYKQIPIGIKFKNKLVYSIKFIMKIIKKLNIFENISTEAFSSNQPTWKKNIQKLNIINSEIDELLKTNIPYGENEDKYERLSKSLNKALKLRNNINQEF